ncbi:MAG: hypothetical protein OEV94_05845 [Deltaproteobacteria bacterium]|nr:hypothetical protein [Deltaproteobacteria bacterium]
MAGVAAAWLLGATAFGVDESPEDRDCPPFNTMCLRADGEGGVDLQSNTAYLEGNVRGRVVKHQISLRAQVLKLIRNERDDLARLMMDRDVVVTQPGREVMADHGLVEQASGLVVVWGNATLTGGNLTVQADEIRMENKGTLDRMRGTATEPFQMKYLGKSPLTENGAPTPVDLPDTLTVTAANGVVDHSKRQISLTGNVTLERVERAWKITAQKIVLTFSPRNELTQFQASGEAALEQPGRTVTADSIVSGNQMTTVLLVGNAKVRKPGEFDLAGDRIEVYSDAGKGIVQNANQKPLVLTIPGQRQTTYQLTQDALNRLEFAGVPRSTLDKLTPLSSRSFLGQEAMTAAVQQALTKEEADQYLNAIVKQAKQE